MIGSIVGTIVTILLDPILIFNYRLGAAEAAWATIIGYGVSDLVLLYFVHTRCHYLAIRWPKRWPSRHLITDLLAIGAILVYTTLFQATGQALGAFVLSLSRQGVVFSLCLVILVPLAGYWGILVTQPLANICTLALGWGWYRHWQKHLKS